MSTPDDLLRSRVRRHPAHPALVWGDRELTYRDLDTAIDHLANALSRETTAGQRVGVLAANTPAFVLGLFAAWRLGAVALPLNARWREYELRRILQDAEPSALVAVDRHGGYSFADLLPVLLPELPSLRRCLFVDALGEVQREIRGLGSVTPEALDAEIGLLLYTSGTTGTPKGALVKSITPADGAEAVNRLLGATSEDVCILIVPVSHAFGLMLLVAALTAGARAVLVDSTFSLLPLVETVRRHHGTVLHGSPAVFTSILKAGFPPLASLRTGLVAGAACPPQVLEQLDRSGLRILNLYGMTELGAVTCCRPNDSPELRYTTVGRPLPGYAVRIAGGENGEVQVGGPYVTPGYYRQPEQTAAALDHWFRTGDIGSLDKDGNLSLSGRAKEVIHVAGLNVFPAEVEAFLLTHPDVLQAAVVGVPHPTLGEAVVAFVVPQPDSGLTPSALLQFARARIAGYKLPYRIHLRPELPLLSSGKPDRAALERSIQKEDHATADTRSHSAL